MKDKNYYKGKIVAYREIRHFVEKKLKEFREQEIPTNTPKQITRDGKVIALLQVKQKLNVKIFKHVGKNIENKG